METIMLTRREQDLKDAEDAEAEALYKVKRAAADRDIHTKGSRKWHVAHEKYLTADKVHSAAVNATDDAHYALLEEE